MFDHSRSRPPWKQHLPAAILFVVLIILIGCAARQASWGDPETGLALEYRMTDGQILKYSSSNAFTQTMEIMGQSVEVTSNETRHFTMACGGPEAGIHQIGVVIDSMSLHIASPRGDLDSDMSGVVGKGFDMTVSKLGKEGDLSGAEEIEFTIGPGETRNIASGFRSFFPDLPDQLVKVGDSWTTRDTITDRSSNAQIEIAVESLNTLDGYEKVHGLDCARILATSTGTLQGEGEQQGMKLAFEGTIEGTDTWYFAYKEGLFVKLVTEGTGATTMTGSGPQEITVPMKREMRMETDLLR
jgi:hypothetical protein